MMPQVWIILTGLLFLLTFVSGALLSNLKKTRNGVMLNLHKFISFLTAITTAVTIYNLMGGKW